MILKNCPFCGGEAGFFEYDSGYRFFASCKNTSDKCPMRMSTRAMSPGRTDKQDASAAWNARSAPTMKPWEWVDLTGVFDADTKAYASNTGFIVYSNKNKSIGEWFAALYTSESLTECDRISGFHKSSDEAEASCIAYVEGKLKEWLVS